MTQDNGSNRPVDGLLDIDPESLSQQQLIDLVRDLQGALASQVRDRCPRPAPAGNVRLRPVSAVPGADYTVFFDGGSLGNPGKGYGSYEIAGPDGTVAARQVQFGNDMTNNQAEFRAVIAALEDLLERVGPRADARFGRHPRRQPACHSRAQRRVARQTPRAATTAPAGC